MYSFRQLILPIVLLFSNPLCLRAQDGAPSDAAEKHRSKYAYLVCTEVPKGVENPVKLLQGGKLEDVVLSLRSASQRVKIPADGKVQLVREVAGAVGKPEIGKGLQLIAHAQMPEGVKQAIIILVPATSAKATEAGLVFETYVQDLAKFDGGSSMYVNLSDMPVGVKIGENKKDVKPGGSLIMQTGVKDEPLSIPVSYWRFNADKSGWQQISASTIAFYPTRREICFFYKRPNGHIGYRGVTCPVEN